MMYKAPHGWTVLIIEELDGVCLVEYCSPINGRQTPMGPQSRSLIRKKDLRPI